MWYGFSGGECGALCRCWYEGAGGRGGGTGPPEDLVCVCSLAVTERAHDIGELEGERGVRDGAALVAMFYAAVFARMVLRSKGGELLGSAPRKKREERVHLEVGHGQA